MAKRSELRHSVFSIIGEDFNTISVIAHLIAHFIPESEDDIDKVIRDRKLSIEPSDFSICCADHLLRMMNHYHKKGFIKATSKVSAPASNTTLRRFMDGDIMFMFHKNSAGYAEFQVSVNVGKDGRILDCISRCIDAAYIVCKKLPDTFFSTVSIFGTEYLKTHMEVVQNLYGEETRSDKGDQTTVGGIGANTIH